MAATATLTLPDAATAAPINEGSIFFIGNATVLLRVAGFTILTDPTFIHKHEQTWLGGGLHTTRLTDPAMELADLPPLDLVLLSHFHGDHFDQVAERELDRALPIVTTPQSAKDLEERGFSKCIPLDVWESLNVEKGPARLRITATPARHGPPMVDLVLPEIPQRFPDIDIALLHLGGTRVLGILVSMDAKQGVEAMRIVDPALAIPIHYNDYDVFTSPLSDFQEEVRAAGLENRVHYLSHGETYTF
ncbi:MAG: putative metal-dependent hydrolase [Thermomicrobiales bacterium]|nr:putative metal-dependent hydrolase [Thermomicrobiales bacterium]